MSNLEKHTINNKSISNHDFAKTITGRFIITVFLLILFLIIFSATLFYLNTKSSKITKEIENTQVPLTSLIAKIYSAKGSVSASQRAYIVTGEAKYKAKRIKTWTQELQPAIAELKKIKSNLNDTEATRSIDTAIVLLNNYKETQKGIDTFYEKKLGKIDSLLRKSSNLSQDSVLFLIKEKDAFTKQLTTQMFSKVSKLQENIEYILNPLNRQQQTTLKEEVLKVRNGIRLTNYIVVLAGIIVILTAVALTYLAIGRLKSSIRRISNILEDIAKGYIDKKENFTGSEFDVLIASSNRLKDNLNSASQFALNIGEGNFDYEFVSANKKDVLGNALLQMRRRLGEVAEEEKKQSWNTKGTAKFGEIIRTNNDSFRKLGDALTEELATYVGVIQAGIFILKDEYADNENFQTLEMISCYAYDRKKYIQKTVKVHQNYAETLIGQAFLEQERILLKEVPDDYINILSGLGQTTPKNILLVPIKSNDKVEGVLELASLKNFEQYQIDFIENLCEMLANSISTVKANERTKALVKELQEQTEVMRSQEEEMRQNMEELSTTQEEMRRRGIELENLKDNLEEEVAERTLALEDTLERMELINEAASEGFWDMKVPESGKVEFDTPFHWSKQLLNTLGYTREEFPDLLQSWVDILHPEDQQEVFKSFVSSLTDYSGQTKFINEHRLRVKSGEYRWFKAGFTAVREEEGKPVRVAGYINDISAQKELDQAFLQLRKQQKEMEIRQAKLEVTNKKLEDSREVLKKAFENSKKQQKNIRLKTEELEKIYTRFKQITKNIPGMIYQYIADLEKSDGKFTYVSDYVEKLLGYTTEEFLAFTGKDLQKLIHVEDRKNYFEKYFYSLKNLKDFKWEGRMKGKKDWVWIRIHSSPIRQQDDTIISDGVFLDITKAKKREAKIENMNKQILSNEKQLINTIKELEKKQRAFEMLNHDLEKASTRFEQITKNIPGTIYQYVANLEKATGRFVYVSDYVEKLFGYTPQEFQNFDTESLRNLIHPDDQKSYFKQYFYCLTNLKNFKWEGRMKGKEDWIWVRSQSSPIKQEDGTLISDGVFLDITDRKEKEKKINHMNEKVLENEKALIKNIEMLEKKQKDIEISNGKLIANEKILKKAFLKMKKNKQEFDETIRKLTKQHELEQKKTPFISQIFRDRPELLLIANQKKQIRLSYAENSSLQVESKKLEDVFTDKIDLDQEEQINQLKANKQEVKIKCTAFEKNKETFYLLVVNKKLIDEK